MYRWAECPGSVKLSEGIPNISSKYAEEGTLAHELAAKLLLEGVADFPSEEMEEAVRLYVGEVLNAAKPKPLDRDGSLTYEHKLLVEHKFDLSKLYPGLFGTSDAVVYEKKDKVLRVFDFKYGAGLGVEVKGNPQLMYYGLGALMSLGLPCITVELVVVQPRFPHREGPVRRWLFDAVEIIDFAADLVEKARATTMPSPVLKAGEHCKFCRAKAICPELSKDAQAMAKRDFATDVKTLAPEKLSEILSKLDLLETWIGGVKEYAYNEAMAGRPPPGFKLVQKRAMRKWADEKEAELKLLSKLTLEQITVSKLKSPAQVEKFLEKQERFVIDNLTVKESSGVVLVPRSDSRPEINVSKAQIDFMNVEKEREK